MLDKLKRIWRPAAFHGMDHAPSYFEGWYYKLVDDSREHRLAVIPGVFLHPDPADSHAFVQTLDGLSGAAHYHRFALDEFEASGSELDVRIGNSRFSQHGLSLDLDREEQRLRGELEFRGVEPWPVTALSPGIMGPFSFTPLMQCYHGVLGLDHALMGELTIDGEHVDFSYGRGYLEKDWGRAFPRAYVWMQTNHFARPGTSLTASVATIPWVRGWFRGFIVGLWHQGTLYRFTTYLGSRITHLALSDTEVDWTLAGVALTPAGPGRRFPRYRLRLRAHRAEGGILSVPTPQGMEPRLVESLTARVEVRLVGLGLLGGETEIFQDTGECAGLEVAGSVSEIVDAG